MMVSTPTRDPLAAAQDEPQMTLQTPSSNADEQGKEIAPFLRSLRRMLDRESDAILCWTQDGHAFEIHDMEVMTSYILPKYFKHAKYTSFQRQLNYFNFRKWTKSRAVVCTFSNAFFVRDEPDLTWRITRKRGLSDAKSPGGGNADAASDGGDASPRTPKSRAAVRPATAAVAATTPVMRATTTKPVTLKRESSTGTKRKAPSSSAASAVRKVARVSSAKTSIVKIEATSAAVPGGPTADAAESLEWVDTLYPSLEALEAECSVSACTTSNAFSNYNYSQQNQYIDQVAYAWPQYPATTTVSSAARPSSPVDRFGLQPPSYESYFVPTVVQTRCVAL
ncbi:Hsf-type dna-binding protein [Globisporangium polare]